MPSGTIEEIDAEIAEKSIMDNQDSVSDFRTIGEVHAAIDHSKALAKQAEANANLQQAIADTINDIRFVIHESIPVVMPTIKSFWNEVVLPTLKESIQK